MKIRIYNAIRCWHDADLSLNLYIATLNICNVSSILTAVQLFVISNSDN